MQFGNIEIGSTSESLLFGSVQALLSQRLNLAEWIDQARLVHTNFARASLEETLCAQLLNGCFLLNLVCIVIVALRS